MSEAVSRFDAHSTATDGAPAGQRDPVRVSGMDCASCAAKIGTALRRLPGVSDVGVSVPSGTVTVSHTGTLAPSDITNQVAALGYTVTGSEPVTTGGRTLAGGWARARGGSRARP